MENNRIIIIDGNSLINRAFYAMQKPMITRDGFFTQGLYGFVNMLNKLRKDYPSGYMAVAFDLKAPTFRHKEYTDYKAGRRKMPPELAMELPVLKELLDAMKIKRVELEGYEADDLIGTISARAEESGMESLIITGDRDEFQLAGDHTKILFTKKGVSEFDLYDRQAFIEEYGFTPLQFIDYKGLMGDPSDNIPGLPGVGKKTAARLIDQFGSVTELLARVDELPAGKLKTNIEENYELAVLSRRLAEINRKAPLDIDWEEYRLTEPDYEQLIPIYRRLEFNRFLKQLDIPEDLQGRIKAGSSGLQAASEGGKAPGAALSVSDVWDAAGLGDSHGDNAVTCGDSAAAATEAVTLETEIISDRQRLDEILENIKTDIADGRISYVPVKTLGDRNHRAVPQVFCLGFVYEGKCWYLGEPELIAGFGAAASEGLPLGGHYVQDDIYNLMSLAPGNYIAVFDTAVARYVADSARSGYSMNAMAAELLGRSLREEDEILAATGQLELFSNHDQSCSSWICEYLECFLNIKPQVEAMLESGRRVYEEIELPLIPVLAEMELRGFGIDSSVLEQQGAELEEEIGRLTAEIYELAGHEFNINSPAQLGTVLFEELELPAGKKTKKGYSTAADILEKIRDRHPIVPLVLEYRTLAKLKGTYVDGMLPLIGKDGRIHAHFRQTVAATGRLSCTEPNLQNIPIRQEYGRRLRKAFVPETGSSFTGADYSQIELRVLAALSEDRELVGAFVRGDDIHRLTAAKVLGIPAEEITPAQRSAAKAVNFGVIYGMSGFGLADELSITRRQAEQYIKDYFAKYTSVRDYMDGLKAACKARGYVETVFGRRRYINEISAGNYMVRQLGERLAMNSPIQGTAADIIKLAMIRVSRALRQAGLKSFLCLQIHDELIIETAPGEEEQVAQLLKDNMESAVTMSVPFTVELGRAGNWYDLK